jgi:hypothetical protein
VLSKAKQIFIPEIKLLSVKAWIDFDALQSQNEPTEFDPDHEANELVERIESRQGVAEAACPISSAIFLDDLGVGHVESESGRPERRFHPPGYRPHRC